MIISAKYIVDNTTDPVIDFYALNSNNPMFSESELNFLRVLRGKAKSAKQMLSRFKKTGDVYKYLKSIIKGNDESTAKKFREFGLVPFEDIIEDFKIVFKDELNDITSIEDFIIEEEYTTWDVIFLAETYRAQSYGILKAKNNMGEVEGIVIRGMFDSEANNYANSWINDDELMYHLIGKDSKTNHINNKELLSGKYPIYVFETIDSNRQVYRGKFTLKQYNQNTHQVHLIRLTGSINLEKTPQIKEYHLPTRSKFTKQVDRRDAIKSGTSIISKNKIESGIKAEKEVLNFFNDIQVHAIDVAEDSSVPFDIFLSDLGIGIEVKNITNASFYISENEIRQIEGGHSRLIFVDGTNILISKSYDQTPELRKIFEQVREIDSYIIDKYNGEFTGDIRVGIVDERETKIKSDFVKINDYTKEKVIEFLTTNFNN